MVGDCVLPGVLPNVALTCLHVPQALWGTVDLVEEDEYETDGEYIDG